MVLAASAGRNNNTKRKVVVKVISRQLNLIVMVTKKKLKRVATKVTPHHIVTTTKKKKQSQPNHFRFKINSFVVDIYSPIVRIKEANNISKLKPVNTERKTTTIDVSPYIVKGITVSDDELSMSSPSESCSGLTTPIRNFVSLDFVNKDDYLDDCFTLSLFRKEIMVAALQQFSSCYSGDVLSGSKLFFNHSFSRHSWQEYKNTNELHEFIMMQYKNKDRICGNSLIICVSLGFSSKDTMSDNLNPYLDGKDIMQFSQEGHVALFPEPKINQTEIRKKSYQKHLQVDSLLQRMYNTDTSVLHHGFLHEHKLTFYAKFSSWLKTARADEHTFFKALESDTEILDEDDVENIF